MILKGAIALWLVIAVALGSDDAALLDNDFDGGLGMFVSAVTGAWSTRSGYTPTGSGKTGPSAGVGGSGSYMYAEATNNVYVPLVLDLAIGHALSGSGVSFYYHLYGNQVGVVTFEVSTNGAATYATLWSKPGQTQGSNTMPWLPATLVFYEAHPGVTHMRFTSTPIGSRGDAAIDAFRILSVPTTVPTPLPTLPPTFVPTLLPSNSRPPSPHPTPLPSVLPTSPTPHPSLPPTRAPTHWPTRAPSPLPSSFFQPTPLPSLSPSPLPTLHPTVLPTPKPTPVPPVVVDLSVYLLPALAVRPPSSARLKSFSFGGWSCRHTLKSPHCYL